MAKFKYMPLIILLFYGFILCNTTEPLGNKGNTVLSLENVNFTEAWIKLNTSNLSINGFIPGGIFKKSIIINYTLLSNTEGADECQE